MTRSPDKSPLIRPAEARDEAAWRRLWAGYLAFYEAAVDEATTDATWRRQFETDSGIFGRVAELDGAIAGFAVCVLHAGSWTRDPVCYLEDLFVDPARRRSGIGTALVADVVALAREQGWSRLYWHTNASNAGARRIYDQFVLADDFVRYRMILE